LCEGFGITPIEAALFGVPVITTRETSIPEVTQNLLHYYEPATDAIRLAEKILEVLREEPDPVRMQSIQETFRNAYSPSTVARRYWECFQNTLEAD
jgi:glycosyltransferase involved in cell wall biosynthesis